ncbi:MAG: phosphoglycerate kinase [Bacteroidetes bacterium]|nr:MAG: phosphoglycerate kinase [Bacteroidota bacterium]
MIKSIDEVRIEGKKVLVRVDFNVPLDDERQVTDDTRIKESLPTIDKIIDYGSIPVLMSHLGRPKGEINLKYSLKPVADLMIDKYGYDVIFAVDCVGERALQAVNEAAVGQVVLLENLRFHKEEEKNDLEFAKQLAQLGDAYVNDAFGSAHRAHASTEAVAKLFDTRLAGYLMINEIEYLGKTVTNPVKPFVAVLGGAKISGKIDVIKYLMDKCSSILIGGGMAYTFFKAMGYNIGKSLLEEDRIQMAKELLDEAKTKNVKLILPSDTIIADSFSNDASFKTVKSDSIPDGWMGMDIGPDTQKLFNEEISKGRTIVWNGPMGVFEMDNFAKGTYSIARQLADVTGRGAITIVGGGDSAAAINKMNFQNKVTHVSTGGGASLEYLEGKILPGVAALEI